jgi:hypothetical protein
MASLKQIEPGLRFECRASGYRQVVPVSSLREAAVSLGHIRGYGTGGTDELGGDGISGPIAGQSYDNLGDALRKSLTLAP